MLPATSKSPAITTGPWPAIPSWQRNALDSLSGAGSLYGLSPRVLAVIDKEESGGDGGGINATDYGGFFGENEAATYPGGTTTPSLLEATTPASFDTQAEIAASSYVEDLASTGGNYVSAEEVYQSGHAGALTPGAKLFETYGFAATTTATLDSLNLGGLSVLGGPTAISSGGDAIGSWIGGKVQNYIVAAALIGGGVALCLLGFYKAANPDKTPKLPGLSDLGDLADVGAAA